MRVTVGHETLEALEPIAANVANFRQYRVYNAPEPFIDDYVTRGGQAGWLWSEVARDEGLNAPQDEDFDAPYSSLLLKVVNKVRKVFLKKTNPSIEVGSSPAYLVFAVIPAAPPDNSYAQSNTHILLLGRKPPKRTEGRSEYKTDPDKEIEGKRKFAAKKGII